MLNISECNCASQDGRQTRVQTLDSRLRCLHFGYLTHNYVSLPRQRLVGGIFWAKPEKIIQNIADKNWSKASMHRVE